MNSMKAGFGLFLFLCAPMLSAGCGGDCAHVVQGTPFALWSEFLPPEEVLDSVPLLKAQGISLYQNVASEQVDAQDPSIAAIFTEAACQGVEVRAWLTLPEDQGYWPNERNMALFEAKAIQLADWISRLGWPVEWIVVDMEPGLDYMNQLMELAARGDYLGIVRLLLENLDPEAYAAAAAGFTSLVETLHSMGFKVMVVTFPLALDDQKAGTNLIQDMLNTPVTGIPWDELSFMTYTTTFSQLFGIDFNSYLVYSYGEDISGFYRERGAVDLGTIGSAGMVPGEGITDVGVLREQVGAAKAAGVGKIHAYSLDGILSLQTQDPSVSVPEWLDAFQAEPSVPPTQGAVVLLRGGIGFIEWLSKAL